MHPYHRHHGGGGGGRNLLSTLLTLMMIYRQLQSLGIFEQGRKLPWATLSLGASAAGLFFFDARILARLLPAFLVDPYCAAIVPRLLVEDFTHQWPRLFLATLHHTSESQSLCSSNCHQPASARATKRRVICSCCSLHFLFVGCCGNPLLPCAAHLYYNLVSLLWRGVRLEDRWGLRRMVLSCVVLTFGSHMIMVLLSWLLYQTDATRAWSDYNSPALGMSGLLFALKVVAHADPTLAGSSAAVAGGLLHVPLRWAAWAELLFVQLLVPNVSFLGHVGGILAGMAYVALVRPYDQDAMDFEQWAAAAAGGFGGGGGGGGGPGPDQPGAPGPRPGTALLLLLLTPLRWIGQALSGNLHAGAGAGEGADQQQQQPPRPRFNHDPRGYALGRRANNDRAAAAAAAAAAGLRHRGAGADGASFGARAAAAAGGEGDGGDDDVQLSGPRPSAPPMPPGGMSASPSPPAFSGDARASGSSAEGQPHHQQEGQASSSSSSGPPYFEDQMSTLYSMGFHDRRANLVALRATKGDIDAAITALV
jgi:hypothetical protein